MKKTKKAKPVRASSKNVGSKKSSESKSAIHHVVSITQFMNEKKLEELYALADHMAACDVAGSCGDPLKGKVLAAVFYEPSTRTRFSFETAMLKLGGGVVSTENAVHFSSVSKGETLEDTVRTISGYADVIVMRHFEEGSAKIAAEVSPVPIINAGDGTGEHPTQALLDVYTIHKELGKFSRLHVAMVGDLLNGRTIHSLLTLLTLYPSVHISFISPSALQLPMKYKELLTKKKISFEEHDDLKKVIGDVDVLYMTRVQKERFSSPEEFERMKNAYIIDTAMLSKMKKKSIIMHPLPRNAEITTDVDKDPRAAYFRQAKNGLHVRMALLQMVLGTHKSV